MLEADQLECRIVAVCCRAWGISPAECRKLQEAGEISVDDFWATLELAVIESAGTALATTLAALTGGNQRIPLLEWIFPDGLDPEDERQRRLNDKFEAIILTPMPADTPEQAEKLEQLKQKVLKEREERRQTSGK